MPVYFYGFIFFISLFLGSFYNVMALRTLTGENVALPPSHCPTCKHRLSPLDLFPVLSWALLKGKCRYCRTPISGLYPFGELLTATAYTLVVYTFGFSWETVLHLVFITIMIWATITDLKATLVPDRFVVSGLILVGGMRIALGIDVWHYFAGGLLAFATLLTVLILSNGKMGGADVKLYALIGLALGYSTAMGSLFYASFLGVILHIPMLIKPHRQREIPFVPFITGGILLTYLYDFYQLSYVLEGWLTTI